MISQIYGFYLLYYEGLIFSKFFPVFFWNNSVCYFSNNCLLVWHRVNIHEGCVKFTWTMFIRIVNCAWNNCAVFYQLRVCSIRVVNTQGIVYSFQAKWNNEPTGNVYTILMMHLHVPNKRLTTTHITTEEIFRSTNFSFCDPGVNTVIKIHCLSRSTVWSENISQERVMNK